MYAASTRPPDGAGTGTKCSCVHPKSHEQRTARKTTRRILLRVLILFLFFSAEADDIDMLKCSRFWRSCQVQNVGGREFRLRQQWGVFHQHLFQWLDEDPLSGIVFALHEDFRLLVVKSARQFLVPTKHNSHIADTATGLKCDNHFFSLYGFAFFSNTSATQRSLSPVAITTIS